MAGRRRRRTTRLALGGAALLLAAACATPAPEPAPAPPTTRPEPDAPTAPAPDTTRRLEVTATAYNSLPGQTNARPSLAAWGDRLEPGMKAIAVSRDLIEMGLDRGTRVRIEGLDGEYVVLDKMARRWRRKIDIYMGEDVQAARRWGRRKVVIRW